MIKLRLKHCKQADIEHELSKRQYAHVGHVYGAICVSNAFYKLPIQHQAALLAHEVGHVLSRRYQGRNGESNADQMAERYFGVKIKYIDSPHGDQLEYVTPSQARRVMEMVISGHGS